MFELPYYGKSFTYVAPSRSKKFNHVVAFSSFLIDPMGDNIPIKKKFMKEKFHVVHHMFTHILFPRQENYGFLIKEEIVAIWMLTQNHRTNRVDGVFNHISQCRMNHSIGFPCRSLIIKVLANARVDFEGESVDTIYCPIDSTYLRKMKACVFRGN